MIQGAATVARIRGNRFTESASVSRLVHTTVRVPACHACLRVMHSNTYYCMHTRHTLASPVLHLCLLSLVCQPDTAQMCAGRIPLTVLQQLHVACAALTRSLYWLLVTGCQLSSLSMCPWLLWCFLCDRRQP